MRENPAITQNTESLVNQDVPLLPKPAADKNGNRKRNFMRPEWHHYFMACAKIVASRSTCNSRPTGAVIVKDNRILSTGYNGAPDKQDQCSDMGSDYCFRRKNNYPEGDKYNFCRSVHAEANAVVQAAKYGVSISSSVIYCTLFPCYVCMKLIKQAGITAVYYELDYRSQDETRDQFWQQTDMIRCVKIEMPDSWKSFDLFHPISERKL